MDTWIAEWEAAEELRKQSIATARVRPDPNRPLLPSQDPLRRDPPQVYLFDKSADEDPTPPSYVSADIVNPVWSASDAWQVVLPGPDFLARKKRVGGREVESLEQLRQRCLNALCSLNEGATAESLMPYVQRTSWDANRRVLEFDDGIMVCNDMCMIHAWYINTCIRYINDMCV